MEITEEQIIEAATEYAENTISIGDKDFLLEAGFKQCARWMKEQFTPGWISVKDRLPKEPDVVYLVCVKNKNKENGIHLIDIAVFDSYGIWKKSTVWENVTHWTNLPSTPEN